MEIPCIFRTEGVLAEAELNCLVAQNKMKLAADQRE